MGRGAHRRRGRDRRGSRARSRLPPDPWMHTRGWGRRVGPPHRAITGAGHPDAAVRWRPQQ
jgi:hypothetical protein